MEAKARVAAKHALHYKLVANAKLEKTYGNSYNDAIIAATTEMRMLKNEIYQVWFEFSLEKA